jgi:signal recognition particle receptor subunit beta
VHIVATAGHVDHGKSTLIQSLTGTDPDRWREEKERGLTIDLGFAHTTLPSGAGVSFIDVPGHVRFLKNMLAGVGAIDACVFVVAATEGWKPQSEEHLRILHLLGVRHGLIAMTKVGLVDRDWRELAIMDIEEHVEGTFLAGAQLVPVDAPAGVGLHEVREALDRLIAKTPPAQDRQRPRLWIDRVFAAKGSGTVVTGTLTGGSVSTDDELLATGPSGQHTVRVRSIQSHGLRSNTIGPGNRVALNLSGVSHEQLLRGDALVRPAQWHHWMCWRRWTMTFHVEAHLPWRWAAASTRSKYVYLAMQPSPQATPDLSGYIFHSHSRCCPAIAASYVTTEENSLLAASRCWTSIRVASPLARHPTHRSNGWSTNAGGSNLTSCFGYRPTPGRGE